MNDPVAEVEIYESITQSPPTTYLQQLVWEAMWEATIIQVFQPGTAPAGFALHSAKIPFNSNAMAEVKDFQLRQLLAHQQNVIKECTPQIIADVHRSWVAADARQRRERVLKGIAAAMAPCLGMARLFCPDSTRTSLLARDGALLFELLDTIVHSGRALPLTEPIFFENTAVNAFLARNALTPAETRALQINRADVLSRIVWKILQVILGRPTDDAAIKPPRVSLSEAIPKIPTAIEIAFREAQREFRADKEYACVRCNKLESEVGAGRAMQRCSRCAVAGRKVLYCSKECQRLDWAQGVPKPHKVTCGRKLGV